MVDLNDPEVIESLKYLLVSREEHIKAQTRPFDAKKNCWVEDHKDGFIFGEIQSADEKKGEFTVKTSRGETITVKSDKIQQMNPPKYEKCEDMADMTYLNDATVLHNLRTRYIDWLIYTYSGLFCVVINPYKRLPVYTMKMVHYYRGKKKNEVPPHLYYVADNAYQSMLKDRENQSMLITGESGAGKTENTKKVIQYFAFVAVSASPKKQQAEDANKPSLEDQIISANPVLEAYGNAKTTRNNNSSRFGKFIRIHFSHQGGIAGADIESYLLEKSRVTFQQPAERNYHIFYQLLDKNYPKYHKDMLCVPDAREYFFTNQGVLTIDNVDDAEEMKVTEDAFDTLNFSTEEKLNLFKLTAAIMHWGNSKWKQRPREEQAEADSTEELEKVSILVGVHLDELLKGLLKPRIKVGNEYVNKGQNKDQVINSIGALSKSIYNRSFNWLVDRVNETLDVKTVKRSFFIGVLDIAGFEIFEYNGFEQLCINYTNERLQQFFNHHMFVLEQEEYTKEGIVWEMMNFGMDLQACIDLIEKPLGIMSILEEECIVPKATDKTFQEKLYANHLGKHPNFGKPKLHKGKAEAHFDLHHYAGTVSYSVTNWLEKNKDPINTTVATSFKTSSNSLLALLYSDMGEEDAKSGKAKKGGSMMTISAGHREQLNKLMHTLKMTSPHFVRCIIPNEIKTGGVIDAHLVMHQLHCNGVLEGIRICRKGFPNRLIYNDFKHRYSILAPNVATQPADAQGNKATAAILKEINFPEDNFRLGHTKVFFKAGMLGYLEELRDAAVARVVTMLQSHIRAYLIKNVFNKMIQQRLALSVLQRNCRAYLSLRNWQWWKLFTKVKPLLQNSKLEEERKAKEEKFKQMEEQIEKDMKYQKDLEEQNTRYQREKKELAAQLEAERIQNEKFGKEKMDKLNAEKSSLEAFIKELEDKINVQENESEGLSSTKKKLEGEIGDLKTNIEGLTSNLQKADADIKSKESTIRKCQEELAQQEEKNQRLHKEKKKLEETIAKTLDDMQQQDEKLMYFTNLKSKLELTLDESEQNLEREKKRAIDLDKNKRRLELELKTSQAQIEEASRAKKDLEDVVKRKDIELTSMSAKMEEQHIQNISLQKKIKEMQQRMTVGEEEIEAERQAKAKVEKQRADLARELDELTERLEEAGGATSAQLDLNKKREAELAKLRRDLEEANLHHEATVAQLRKKHQDAVAEMGEQIDQLQKIRAKLEKEKLQVRSELEEHKLQHELTVKAKGNVEKLAKQLEQQLQDLMSKLDDSHRQIIELNSLKNKIQNENNALLKQLDENEANFTAFTKIKQQLQCQVEEARRLAEEESRGKNALVQQLKSVNMDIAQVREQCEEEVAIRIEAQKAVTRITAELHQWRSKYEAEGLSRAEELEEVKRKLAAKLTEAEEQVEQALAKCNSLEKTKMRLQSEVEDLMVDVERANSNAATMEKKQKQFDKLIGEWKQKCEDITLELEASQKEARQYSTELFKLKTQYDESLEQIEGLKRENKNLAEEIKDLMTQISDGGKSIYECEKDRKRLEVEKEELQNALEEAEGAIEQEEIKITRISMELSGVRAEIERRLKEKEDEFENTRRNHQRAIESMQASVEAEIKAKTEVLRQKKKLESDINELEIGLDNSNKTNSELQKLVKKLQTSITELNLQLEEEHRARSDAIESASQAERRVNMLSVELDELHQTIEQNERSRKALENELHEAADRISELSSSNANITAHKRKLESDLATTHADLEEAVAEFKNSEERCKKASADAARLAEELRQEQEHALNVDKLRKNLEQQVKDLQVRLDEAEVNALKGGKRIIQKLEQRIHGLENELELEQRHHQEALKEIRKSDRKLKEIALQLDDERRNGLRLQDLIDKLQDKLKTYRRQAEEAEEVASVNFSKLRKVQIELDESASSADKSTAQVENQMALVRANTRSTHSLERSSLSLLANTNRLARASSIKY